MIQSGLLPQKQDHRDYDFLKTFGAPASPKFPDALNVDAGLWIPNQLTSNPEFNLPPMPTGCTNFTQADLCADDDEKLYNPMILEGITHANENGGANIRVSLDAAKKAFNRTAYFNIRPKTGLDYFDAVRLAMMSGAPEKRAVSVGTPWYSLFESVGKDGILGTPEDLKDISAWHNHKIAGWKTINGSPYLISKSWQGKDYGDGGFVYFSRSLFNSAMSIPGSCAYTLTNMGSDAVQKIDLPFLQLVLSFIRNLLTYAY